MRPLAALALLAGGLGGCALLGPAPGPPSAEFEAIWAGYQDLPDQRALAVAGQLQRNQWVAGASGGHPTRAEAEREALRECERRRSARRIVDACRLYVVGDDLKDSRARGR